MTTDSPAPSAKDYAAAAAGVRLDSFLASGRTLDVGPISRPPRVSALVLLCNRAEVTLSCLQSLAAADARTSTEVVLVDNGSSDRTGELLARVTGAKVVTNRTNVGYPVGVNQAAREADGDYLLLLNNDVEVLGRSVDAAADYLDRHPDVGMVGGRVVLLDGTLQEAGCAILSDGWARQIARGRPADDPSVRYERTVDYCSGAFLMVRRDLFRAVGGLDEVYSPGYFEDPDLAVKFHRRGFRTVCLPDVAVLHYENATSERLYDTTALVRRNHAVFRDRHADWLAEQTRAGDWCDYHRRRADDTAINALVFPGDDGPPTSTLVRVLEAFDAMPTVVAPADPASASPLRTGLPPTCEAVALASATDLDRFLAGRPGYFDLAITGRPLDADRRSAMARHHIPVAAATAQGYRWLD